MEMMMGRYEQLEAFVEVVDQQSFSGAGERMGLAKSVLSRRVSELENRLGVKLLNRTTRKLSLTGAGEQLYQQASELIVGLLDAEQKVSDEQLSLSGRLKIAAPQSFGYRHLSSAIAEFIKQNPDIDISMDLNDRKLDLVAEGFDLTIRIGGLEDSTLIARKLGVIRFVTAASAEYLKKQGEPQHPSDLVNHQGLMYANISARQQWTFVDNKQTIIAVPQQRLSANNGDFLNRAAIEGLGIVISPTFLAYEYIRSGELIPILQEFQPEGTGIYAIFPPGRLIPRRAKLLVEYLQQQYGDCPAWDKGLV
jgi:DNA-binding transcriptional LysR family regulator